MTDGQLDARAGGAGTANQRRPPSVVLRIRSDRQPFAAHGGTASSQPVDPEMKLAEIGLRAEGAAEGDADEVHAGRIANPNTMQAMTAPRIRTHWRSSRGDLLPMLSVTPQRD
jgi:hypothetical protein